MGYYVSLRQLDHHLAIITILSIFWVPLSVATSDFMIVSSSAWVDFMSVLRFGRSTHWVLSIAAHCPPSLQLPTMVVGRNVEKITQVGDL